MQLERKQKMKISLKIPDMTCDHCKMTINKALNELSGVQSIKIELDRQVAEVEGTMPVDGVMRAIRQAGYTIGEILSVE